MANAAEAINTAVLGLWPHNTCILNGRFRPKQNSTFCWRSLYGPLCFASLDLEGQKVFTIVTEVKHYSYNHSSSSGKAGNSQPIKQRDRDSTDYTDQIYCIWAHTVFGQKFYLGDLASLFTFSGRDWEMSLGNKWAMDLDCVGGIFFFQQVDRCHSS